MPLRAPSPQLTRAAALLAGVAVSARLREACPYNRRLRLHLESRSGAPPIEPGPFDDGKHWTVVSNVPQRGFHGPRMRWGTYTTDRLPELLADLSGPSFLAWLDGVRASAETTPRTALEAAVRAAIARQIRELGDEE